MVHSIKNHSWTPDSGPHLNHREGNTFAMLFKRWDNQKQQIQVPRQSLVLNWIFSIVTQENLETLIKWDWMVRGIRRDYKEILYALFSNTKSKKWQIKEFKCMSPNSAAKIITKSRLISSNLKAITWFFYFNIHQESPAFVEILCS